MIKLGNIEFDDGIQDAIRDNRLVVFAGAGVSMGHPSNLASFRKLSHDIAQGTSLTPSDNEPLDRFLGRLDHRRVDVHGRAAKLLTSGDSAPNELHQNLLRLFRTADDVRLITTNFDLHFETAAKSLFNAIPDIYCAPALPLGDDFSGIVHVHGALSRKTDLILTDADFGRAYLTEGWARRFLVEVFRSYTVLFVGYSHDDVVMNYLARALPADHSAGRFALTSEEGSWELLNIEPILFEKGEGADSFKDLYKGVQHLAERNARGALDWKTRLAEIGHHAPISEEDTIEIECALREVHTTSFLLGAARDPDWLPWMSARKYFDALFGIADLGERDSLLCNWLAEYFVIEYAYEVFEIMTERELQLHPEFWYQISRQFGVQKDKPLEPTALRRWVTILLKTKPRYVDSHALLWLAERCSDQECFEFGLQVFLVMCEHQLCLKLGCRWQVAENDNQSDQWRASFSLRSGHWVLNEVWTKHLYPHIAEISTSLLSCVVTRLEDMHSDLLAWDQASSEWDTFSSGRSAIEPHKQDEDRKEAIDILINTLRDTLEWVADNSPSQLSFWVERLVVSRAPILHRLAVHAITVQGELSPDLRLKWLLDQVGLYSPALHHEVYRAVALDYPLATDSTRKDVVMAVLAHTKPNVDVQSAESRTARAHFDWLSWLLRAKQDCVFARAALDPIKEQYSNWALSEHPDFLFWTAPSEWAGFQSPWSAKQMIGMPLLEQIDDLVKFNRKDFNGPSREGLLFEVREACKQKSSWALSLARILDEKKLWSSDLWPTLIQGLRDSNPTRDEFRELLDLISRQELCAAYALDIAKLLHALVQDKGKPFASDLLDQANAIAYLVWEEIDAGEEGDNFSGSDWLIRAINRPAGAIVEFWIDGLSVLMSECAIAERLLPEKYRNWFTSVIGGASLEAGFGRSVLANRTAYLFKLDEEWARANLITLFREQDNKKFTQAWDGFLFSARLFPSLVKALLPAFIDAMPRLSRDLSEQRERFVETYTSLAIFQVPDPTEDLVPALFHHGSLGDRAVFARRIAYFLRPMKEDAKKVLWESWLQRYWENRLSGVPVTLEQSEILEMLAWLPHLGDDFPAAVRLALGFPPVQLRDAGLLWDLRESELVKKFPNDTADLLICFSKNVEGYQKDELAKIYERVHGVSAEQRQRVEEAFARAGVPK